MVESRKEAPPVFIKKADDWILFAKKDKMH